jgi:Icc-related predicted phosphoesterase
MAFTDPEKTDIRRFCGYGAFGGGNPLPASGYRFSTQYGVLEYKMNNLSASEEIVARTIYLANLATLETAIFGVSANLDTAKAAVWEHNKNEQRDRENLFNSTRRRFCGFLGIAPGPELGSGGISLVV